MTGPDIAPAPCAREFAHGFSRIGVVGGGLMGSGIAEICAYADCDVIVAETDPDRADQARARIEASLERVTRGGRHAPDQAGAVLGRIRTVASVEELADRDLVVEAIVESEAPRSTSSTNSTGSCRNPMPCWRPARPRFRS